MPFGASCSLRAQAQPVTWCRVLHMPFCVRSSPQWVLFVGPAPQVRRRALACSHPPVQCSPLLFSPRNPPPLGARVSGHGSRPVLQGRAGRGGNGPDTPRPDRTCSWRGGTLGSLEFSGPQLMPIPRLHGAGQPSHAHPRAPWVVHTKGYRFLFVLPSPFRSCFICGRGLCLRHMGMELPCPWGHTHTHTHTYTHTHSWDVLSP